MTTLDYTPEIAADTAPLYAKVKHVVPEIEWPAFAPTIAAINRLKREPEAAPAPAEPPPGPRPD